MVNPLEKLPIKERRGSRARCVLLTAGTRAEVAARLTAMVAPHAIVNQDHIWTPNGFANPAEGKLGVTQGFLSDQQREDISNWWLTIRHPAANTPNWDIISQATIDDREGLILIEAKAHDKELIKEEGGKALDATASQDSCSNHTGIGACIDGASRELSLSTGLVWNLSRDAHYQMANRFAWAWKVTTMGLPVVLVYLGFLKAEEMKDRGTPFTDHEQWKQLVETQSQTLFPNAVWGKTWDTKRAKLIPLILSETRRLS